MNVTIYKYIICLLDLNDSKKQKSLFDLETNKTLHEVSMLCGYKPLKKALGNNWELNVSFEGKQADGDQLKLNGNVVKIFKTIIDRIERLELKGKAQTIFLPANAPSPLKNLCLRQRED